MREGLVSIVIPAYNAETFIGETINTVIKQSYIDWELLVIDDGSPDNLGEVVKELAENESRISYFKKENGGVSLARNFGLEKANGEYIVFLDSDDLWSEDFLAQRVSFLEKNKDYQGCASAVVLVDEEGAVIEEGYRALVTNEELFAFSDRVQTCPSSYMFRKEFLSQNEIYFDSKLFNTADRHLLHQVLNLGKLGYCEESIMYYRILNQSMSRKISKKLIDDFVNYIQILSDEGLVPSKKAGKYFGRYLYTCAAYSLFLKEYKLLFSFVYQSILASPVTFFRLALKLER